MASPLWAIEAVALDSTGDLVADSLGARVIDLQTGQVADSADITAIRAVTDVIPDAGAMTSIAQEASITAAQADITAIMAVTDVLPDAGALTSISDETDKIDGAAASGLSGTSGSLSYMIGELERHFHNRERWWGAVAVPDETNAIEANVNRPFVAVSGANAWGAAIPILGTADDPTPGDGDTKYDCHRVLITDLDDDTTPWRLRIIWGSGTSGDAISAGQWTEAMVMTNAVPGNRAGGSPVDIIMRREDVGMKLWCAVWNATGAEELSFFYGVHGYIA